MQKTLQNPSLLISFRWNISHNTHRKGCAMKFSQRKNHVLRPYILRIVLQDLYEGGADFTCLSVCVSKSSQKS